MRFSFLSICLIGITCLAHPLRAQSLATEAADHAADIQRRQDQQLELQRERAVQRPDVLSDPDAPVTGSEVLRLPQESPCFEIREVLWDGDSPPAQLRRQAEVSTGTCVGGRGLQMLQQRLTAILIERGQITARVLIPEQSLRDGRLILRYLPGRISAVEGDPTIGWWRTVVPTGPGGNLNQRDLDQALENMRRLSGQADASIDVVPGAGLGESDIHIRPGTGKRWHGYVGGDNSGMQSIDREQVYAGLTLDSPLFLYDQLSVSWSSNAGWRDHDSNTRAGSINYSIPFGYWMFFAGAGKSTYRQTLPGFDEPLIYSGSTKQWQAGVSVVPYRGPSYKGSASLAVVRKRTSSALNDVAIDVQRRDMTGYELNVGHRHYVGRAVLDIGGGVRGTMPQFSDRPGFVFGDPDWNGQSTILTARAGLYLPFRWGEQALAYQANWQIQHAKTAIIPADYFNIGNRYTVRGFDGQMTLAGEDGWYLRNDLSFNLDRLLRTPGHQLYAALDAGRVGGASSQYLTERTLIGAAIGVRGRLSLPYVTAGYDLSAGWPLKKPQALKTAPTVYSLAVIFEF
ncbi:ShlB/FhaC/HecB family hemolysin secretion/activation protein [Bordetella sp. 15P40C-2]|nr:ShlB/FhaC/HecB family hemolysin secretion/activation protein [Bordetella sp. 15P40C-2]